MSASGILSRARIAEWLLAQVLPPDRAHSAVGDWMEDASARGALWFWSCVFRTVIAHVWIDLAEHPVAIARVGLIGFGMNLLVPMGFAILVSFFRHGDIRYQHDDLWSMMFVHRAGEFPPHWVLRWQVDLAINLLWGASLFRTGAWIARRMPTREVAGCVAVMVVGWIAILAVDVFSPRGALDFQFAPRVLGVGIAHDLVLFSGALLMRRMVRQAAKI